MSECLRHEAIANCTLMVPVIKLIKSTVPAVMLSSFKAMVLWKNVKMKLTFTCLNIIVMNSILKCFLVSSAHGKNSADATERTVKNLFDQAVADGKDIFSVEDCIDAITKSPEKNIFFSLQPIKRKL